MSVKVVRYTPPSPKITGTGFKKDVIDFICLIINTGDCISHLV